VDRRHGGNQRGSHRPFGSVSTTSEPTTAAAAAAAAVAAGRCAQSPRMHDQHVLEAVWVCIRVRAYACLSLSVSRDASSIHESVHWLYSHRIFAHCAATSMRLTHARALVLSQTTHPHILVIAMMSCSDCIVIRPLPNARLDVFTHAHSLPFKQHHPLFLSLLTRSHHCLTAHHTAQRRPTIFSLRTRRLRRSSRSSQRTAVDLLTAFRAEWVSIPSSARRTRVTLPRFAHWVG